ncbi:MULTISPECIES: diacylglycerol kinase family protein [Chryseobacterium group]|uniref:Diacylglycerol kinase n=3 Tax=Chryseobacterium group TaxID=2782232 RepID=A0A085B5X0_9FLAO|nr:MULTISPECIES: diacylglycerol kinase family protein [Chryseobacterium group]AZA89800.1 diacylglycerol kinase family protein [Chryseobacterium nakagawai]KFC17865.1 diacylglycerol kinase [Epilithonimonas lactis]SEQ77158.1 diacylglycerol kinase (ATP) [Epilithonimonas lactis]SMP11890.1 diacylglycerol kinase (ATP) [Chryseobacterium profundimaris]VEH21196.1 Undecaprenol kinase [Chryseobacterium nakagawai]
MKNINDSFLKGRAKSLKYTFNGAFLLLKTEHSIMTQSFIGVIFVALGFYFKITKVEWMFQIFGFGLILTAESLNTAVEKLCDFVHPEYHKKIGFIKDIASGAMTFAVISVLILLTLIYYPYL